MLSFDSNQWKKKIHLYIVFLMLLIVDSPCAEPIDIRPHSWRMLVHSSASQLERLSFSTLFLHTYNNLLYNHIVFYIIFYCTFILFMVLFRTNSVFYACVCVEFLFGYYYIIIILLTFRLHVFITLPKSQNRFLL